MLRGDSNVSSTMYHYVILQERYISYNKYKYCMVTVYNGHQMIRNRKKWDMKQPHRDNMTQRQTQITTEMSLYQKRNQCNRRCKKERKTVLKRKKMTSYKKPTLCELLSSNISACIEVTNSSKWHHVEELWVNCGVNVKLYLRVVFHEVILKLHQLERVEVEGVGNHPF